MNDFRPASDTALLILGDPYTASAHNESTYKKLFRKASALQREMPVVWIFDRAVLTSRTNELEGRHGFIGVQDLPGITFPVDGADDVFENHRFAKWLRGTFHGEIKNIEIAAIMASSSALNTAISAINTGFSPRFISDVLVDMDNALLSTSVLAGDKLAKTGIPTVELNDVEPVRKTPASPARKNYAHLLGRHVR